MSASEYDRGLAIKNLTKISGPLDHCYDLWQKNAEREFNPEGNEGIPYPGYPIYTPPRPTASDPQGYSAQKLMWPGLPFFCRLKICW